MANPTPRDVELAHEPTAGAPPEPDADECDNCAAAMDGNVAATSDVCLDCWNRAKELLGRVEKYAREDRATTPGTTRLARVLMSVRAFLGIPSPSAPTETKETP